ncbi:hypothetical protein K9M74_01725 [Candidatus Woesearchaeota archaeon]|nr:hypothetical protein [Candidatus Woesearchaeota archaeon]
MEEFTQQQLAALINDNEFELAHLFKTHRLQSFLLDNVSDILANYAFLSEPNPYHINLLAIQYSRFTPQDFSAQPLSHCIATLTDVFRFKYAHLEKVTNPRYIFLNDVFLREIPSQPVVVNLYKHSHRQFEIVDMLGQSIQGLFSYSLYLDSHRKEYEEAVSYGFPTKNVAIQGYALPQDYYTHKGELVTKKPLLLVESIIPDSNGDGDNLVNLFQTPVLDDAF